MYQTIEHIIIIAMLIYIMIKTANTENIITKLKKEIDILKSKEGK